jgi:hypothetical protein
MQRSRPSAPRCARLEAYGRVNLLVGASLASGKYDAVAWANNAFDWHHFTHGGVIFKTGSDPFGVSGRPSMRTSGATFRTNL